MQHFPASALHNNHKNHLDVPLTFSTAAQCLPQWQIYKTWETGPFPANGGNKQSLTVHNGNDSFKFTMCPKYVKSPCKLVLPLLNKANSSSNNNNNNKNINETGERGILIILKFLLSAFVAESPLTRNWVIVSKQSPQNWGACPPPGWRASGGSHSEHLCALNIRPGKWAGNVGGVKKERRNSGSKLPAGEMTLDKWLDVCGL